MGGVDATSATKSLDLCQALIGQGQAFTFSLTYTGTSYTFSLDTRSKEIPSPMARKKTSPSTLRRNARRREVFLKRRAETPPKAVVTAAEEPEVPGSWSSELVGGTKSVKVKLKKKPPEYIPQVDGHIDEECSTDAEVQTIDMKPETKEIAVQADKPAPTPTLGFSEVQIWTNQPIEVKRAPSRAPSPNMGPYPKNNMGPYPKTNMGPYPKTIMGPYPKTNMGPYKPPHHR